MKGFARQLYLIAGRCLLAAMLSNLWPLSSTVFAESEEEWIEKAFELDVFGQKEPEKAALLVAESLKILEDRKFSRVWYYFLSMTDETYFHEMGLTRERIQQDLKMLYDTQLELRFLRSWANATHEQGQSYEAVKQKYQEGINLCRQSMHREVCGGIYQDFAIFLYESNQIGEALTFAKTSHQLLEGLKPSRQVWLYRSKVLLAMLLHLAGLDKQAMFLRKDAYQWFAQEKFEDDASRTALSLAISYVNSNTPDLAQAQEYFDNALRNAANSKDERLHAQAQIVKGKILTLSGKLFEGEKTLVAAAKSLEKQKIYKFSTHAYIFAARNAFERRDLETAKKYLQAAAKYLKDELNFEVQIYHETAAQLASLEQRYFDEAEHLKSQLKAFKIQKASEEELQKIESSVSLGLAIEEQKNAQLEQENLLQKEKIKTAEKIRILAVLILVFALLTSCLWIKTSRQKKKIARRETDMRAILDHIDEGLIMIERDHTLNQVFSSKSQDLLAKSNLKEASFSRDIVPLFELSQEAQSMLIEAINHSLGEDEISFQMNEGHFLQEFIVKSSQSILNAKWFPILTPDLKINRLLLCLQDVTHNRKMALALEKEQKIKQSLPSRVLELLQAPSQDLNRFFERMQQVLQSLKQPEQHVSVRPAMHSLKGEARALRLTGLSESIHDWESLVEASANSRQATEQLQTSLDQYLFFWETLSKNSRALTPNLNQDLFGLIQELLPAWLDQTRGQDLPWQSLSIKQQGQALSNWEKDLLREVVYLGITNAIDHGYLLPLREGKSSSGIAISIEVFENHEGRHCLIQDEGFGIAIDKLQAKAKARGLYLSNEEEISDFLFQDGLSTALQVSATSGRGLGLSRIRELVTERGGQVSLRNRGDRSGTCLHLCWPQAQLLAG